MENLKKLGLPESFCFAPYTNLDLDQDGTFYPCYRSKEPQGYWKKYDITQTMNSSGMQTLRMDLWNGRENANCIQCHRRERQGLESTRQQYNEHLLELVDNTDFVEEIKNKPMFSGPEHVHTLEVRPHSLCQMACGHCDENSSSRWLKMKKLNKEGYKYHLIDDPETLKKFYNKAGNLKTIHFTGGEPLIYASAHLEWLKGIPNKSEVELRYHTNLNHDRVGAYDIMWREFKHVKFFLSIDVSERYYPYFRFGGDWKRMDYNLDKVLENHEVLGVITVNFFTMLDLVSLVKYIVSKNLQLHVAFVDPPHPLSIVYMSNSQKELAKEQIQEAKLELRGMEDWKIIRGLSALRKIEDFIDSEYEGDEMNPTLIKHLEFLDKQYKMRWNEL